MSDSDGEESTPSARLRNWLKLKRRGRKRDEALRDALEEIIEEVEAEGESLEDGEPITAAEWSARQCDWLPSEQDRGFVGSLMQRVTEPGKFAGWIAPPDGGINNHGLAYEYVRLN